jgi:DNA modification methylase
MGFEINPFAALVCQVKIEALQHDTREILEAAKLMETTIRNRLRDSSAVTERLSPKGFRTRDKFFSPRIERQVLFVKDFISQQQQWLQRLLRVALGSVIVGVSNYSYEPSLGRRIAAGKQEILDADLPGILREKLAEMAADIDSFRREINLSAIPEALVFCKSFLTEALNCVVPASIDVLLTSPPYLNNYHYVRNTRPQLYWLDLVSESSALRELETSSFGKFWQTVRSESEIPLKFSYPELEERLSDLRTVHPDRGAYGGPGWANYAATYFNDCASFCDIAARLMKPGGLAVIVIGNNILQGIEFKNDEILAHIAGQRGFTVQALHVVRKKRTGSSLINSSVRVGTANKKAQLYETAIELRRNRH